MATEQQERAEHVLTLLREAGCISAVQGWGAVQTAIEMAIALTEPIAKHDPGAPMQQQSAPTNVVKLRPR
jgi:hypothetical protein